MRIMLNNFLVQILLMAKSDPILVLGGLSLFWYLQNMIQDPKNQSEPPLF